MKSRLEDRVEGITRKVIYNFPNEVKMFYGDFCC